jgi:hypothetical protein
MTLAIPNQPPVRKEIDQDKWRLREEARQAVKSWQAELDRLSLEIQAEAGEATSLTVQGVEVATYAPINAWRGRDLVRDYPDLTSHYMETTVKFNANLFAARHPDIAEKYQTRRFEVK